MVLLGRLENEKVASFVRLSRSCGVVWLCGFLVAVLVCRNGNMSKGIRKGGGSQKQRIYSTKRAKKWGFVVKITTGENVGFSGVKVSKIVECCKKYNKKIVQNP